MAISINWGTSVIFVPQSYLTFISGALYELDVNAFRLALKDLEDDPEGMPYLRTHNHNTEVPLAGVTYARTVEIVNNYTVEFEDGAYVVSCIGANHNISDVKVLNSTSLIVNNAGGLILNSASATPQEVWDYAKDNITDSATIGHQVTDIHKASYNRRYWDKVGNTITIYADDNITPLYVFDTNSDLSEITPQ